MIPNDAEMGRLDAVGGAGIEVLEYAQALNDSHKPINYPRIEKAVTSPGERLFFRLRLYVVRRQMPQHLRGVSTFY
jgi:hypothetical protein